MKSDKILMVAVFSHVTYIQCYHCCSQDQFIGSLDLFVLAKYQEISNYLIATDLLIVFVISCQIWILLKISLLEVYDII
jgi:hypothetical protein